MKVVFYSFLVVIILVVGWSIRKDSLEKITVQDGEGILTEQQVSQFDSLFRSHEKKTSNEIALVTTADYGLDTTISSFALTFANKQGIGKKDKNNGVVVAFSRRYRSTNISTGLGTEKVLTDEIAKKIIDSIMIPRFREGREGEGLWDGCKAIVEFLERPENKIH